MTGANRTEARRLVADYLKERQVGPAPSEKAVDPSDTRHDNSPIGVAQIADVGEEIGTILSSRRFHGAVVRMQIASRRYQGAAGCGFICRGCLRSRYESASGRRASVNRRGAA